MKSDKKTMFAIKKTSNFGWSHEGEYPTREAAQAVLDCMRESAKSRSAMRAEWLAAHPKPWNEADSHKAWIEGFDGSTTPIEDFESRGWHIEEIPASDQVYRLNTLPNESSTLVREIETKMEIFGNCTLSWTCTGHTRAEWQSESAASQLRKLHPEWKVVNTGYDVRISA